MQINAHTLCIHFTHFMHKIHHIILICRCAGYHHYR